MILFSDRGTPDGYHNMHGYSGHTMKFVKEDGTYTYIQIHLRADKGFKVHEIYMLLKIEAHPVLDI